MKNLLILSLFVVFVAGLSAQNVFNPPTNLVATPAYGSVHLVWGAPAEGSTYTLYEYRIYRNGSVINTPSTNAYFYNDTSVTNGTLYTYYVIARYSYGSYESIPSNIVTVTTPTPIFNPPQNLVAVAGHQSVSLSWEAPESIAQGTLSGYTVYRNSSSQSTTTSTSYSQTGLSNGTAYTYYVVANYTNPTGTSNPSNTVSVTPNPVSNPPQNLTVTSNMGSVSLAWSAPEAGSTYTLNSYYIYKDGNQLATISNTSTRTYTDTSVTVGTTYTYYILARYYNSSNLTYVNSPPSNTVTVTPVHLFNPPRSLTASVSYGTVSLSWQAPNTGSTGTFVTYHVYRDSTGVASVTGTSFTDSSVTGGTAYTYYVVAQYTNGYSEPSNTAYGTPLIANPPRNLTAVAGSGSVSLSWDAPQTGGNGTLSNYAVYRNGASQGTTTSSAYSQTGLSHGTTYTYYVVAYYSNPTGESSPSNSVSATTPDAVHNPPQNLTVTSTQGSINLSWSAPETGSTYSLSGYYVYRNGNVLNSSYITSQTYNDTNVTIGTTYSYYITAYYQSGNSSTPSNTVTDTPIGLYNPPRNLTATAEYGAVSLSWQAPNSGSSGSLITYHVYQDSVGIASVTTTSYSDSNVVGGISYQYYIIAQYTNGYSEHSNIAHATPLIANPPRNLTAQAGSGSISLSWDAPETGGNGTLSSYTVYRNGTSQGTTTTTVYTQTYLTNGTSYTYYVVANYTNPAGVSEPSNTITATLTAVYNPPQNLTVTSSIGSVSLSWSAPETGNSSTLYGYYVYRNGSALNSSYTTSQTYNDTSVTIGSSYTYYITAYYQSGTDSSPSNTVTVTPVGLFNPPRNLTTSVGYGTINLSWQAPSTGSSGTLVSYHVYRDSTGIESITNTSYTDVNVTGGTPYSYYIVAQYTNGYSEPSNIAHATPLIANPPRNLTAQAGNGSVSLTWEAPATGNSGSLSNYSVYRNNTFVTSVSNLTYSNTGLTNGMSYIFHVVANYTSPAGSSIPSNSVSATPTVGFNPPQNLVATAGNGSVSLTWSAPTNSGNATLSGYKVYRNGTAMPSTLPTNTLTYSDTGLNNGILYNHFVTAVYTNPTGESSNSNVVQTMPFLPIFNPPTNLTANAAIGVVSLSWSAPATGGPGTLSGYRVFRSGTFITGTITNTSYQDQTGIYGNLYTYYVVAVYTNPTGESVASNTTQSMPLIELLPPASLAHYVTEQEVTLYWQAPNSQYVTGYNIYRDGVLIGSSSDLQFTQQLVEEGVYLYSVRAVYRLGDESDPVTTEVSVSVSEIDIVTGANKSGLLGNYPNPFNPNTNISYYMAHGGNVTIEVYNNKGQKIKALVDGVQSSGEHIVVWDGRDDSGKNVSSGIYLYKMECDDYVSIKKMVLMK